MEIWRDLAGLGRRFGWVLRFGRVGGMRVCLIGEMGGLQIWLDWRFVWVGDLALFDLDWVWVEMQIWVSWPELGFRIGWVGDLVERCCWAGDWVGLGWDNLDRMDDLVRFEISLDWGWTVLEILLGLEICLCCAGDLVGFGDLAR